MAKYGVSSNYFIGFLASSPAGGGSETTIFLSSIKNLLGETISTADFAKFGLGEMTIDPLSSTNIESAYFTAVDSTAVSVTGVVRALSGVGSDTDPSRAIYHPVGTMVIITYGVHTMNAQVNYFVSKTTTETISGVKHFTVSPTAPDPISAQEVATLHYVQSVLAGSVGTASTTQFGTTKMSAAPATLNTPIVLDTNDARFKNTDSGTPLDGTANKIVDTADTTGTGLIPRQSALTAAIKFGGNGSDGALTSASGTTTINLAGASEFIKNYTSISLTGTANVVFTNPHANGTVIVLRSQGVVTLTSSATPIIDASGLGSLYGAGAVNSGFLASGGSANNTLRLKYIRLNGGQGGGTSFGGGGGGTKDFSFDYLTSGTFPTEVSQMYDFLLPGSGGAGGNANSAGTAGHGGRGGGALLIECGGAFNFTTASGISVAGQNGQNVVSGTSNGGGAGGGAGILMVLYNSLTANSGTVTITGGSAGTKTGVGIDGGGGGASLVAAGSVGASGTGGTGGAGLSIIRQNIIRA